MSRINLSNASGTHFSGVRRILLPVSHLGKTATWVLLALLLPATAQTAPPAPKPDTFRIAGTVINAMTFHPIAGARVIIASAGNRQPTGSVVTSDNGQFKFDNLRAGKYPLQGAAKGFVTSTYDQHGQFSTAIVTGAAVDTENLVLRLFPSAALSGVVLDESDEPVRHATVTVYREDHSSGVGRIRHLRTANTDDLGSYEFTDLDPGTYFLSVSATPWYAIHPALLGQGAPSNPPSQVDRSLDVAYPVTYYADTPDSDAATPLALRGGDHPEIDFHLDPLPTVHLLYRVPNFKAEAGGGFSMPELQKRSFDGMDAPQSVNWQPLSEGVFELTGVPAGSYVVRTASPDGSGPRTSEIDLTKDGQELETSAGAARARVKATLQIPGEGPPAAASASTEGAPVQIVVTLSDGRGREVTALPANEKGEVNFQNLAPGGYEVRILSNQKRYSVARISSASGSTAGHTLTVNPGAQLDVTLVLVGSSATIEGLVKRSGRPVAGAMIVLVPANPGADRDLYRRDQSDLDGSFTLPGVIPGAYTVVAIENGWDLDWAQPPVISRYLPNGQPVTVPADKQGPIRLSDPLEVQPR